MFTTIAFAVFFTATGAVAQVADTPEEEPGGAEFKVAERGPEQIVGVTSMLYVVPAMRAICAG